MLSHHCHTPPQPPRNDSECSSEYPAASFTVACAHGLAHKIDSAHPHTPKPPTASRPAPSQRVRQRARARTIEREHEAMASRFNVRGHFRRFIPGGSGCSLAGWLLSGLLTEGQPKQECFPANICATMHRAYTILSMLRCARAPWPIYCVRTGLMGALIKCRRKYSASINV